MNKMLEVVKCCTTNKRKKGRNDKRRFSDEQIRRMEVIFESETKLEPRKKLEVARELGLQPRQVAIWFQNKRARWKSKHIEKEHALLLANYNALAAQFESLKKEKNLLLLQLEKLKNEEMGRCGSSDGESVCVKEQVNDFEVRNDLLSVSDDDSRNMNAELLQLHDQDELLKMVDNNTSDWGSLESDDIDITQSSVQWWDFWS